MKLYDHYTVSTREEYEALKKRGIELLYGEKNLPLDIKLRKELQQELFGRGNHQEANQKFYKLAWEGAASKGMTGHYCQECFKPLKEYSATYISHILSRGAYPEMAYDLRNYNLLCAEHHQQWESGDREKMRIYKRNMKTIEKLKRDYNDVD